MTTPQSQEELREQVARVIDPSRWKTFDARIAPGHYATEVAIATRREWAKDCVKASLAKADTIISLLRHAEGVGWKATHRHKERGSLYRVFGQALLQTAKDAPDDAHLILYQGEDGLLWARPSDEFYDGRFESLAEFPVTPALPNPPQEGRGE